MRAMEVRLQAEFLFPAKSEMVVHLQLGNADSIFTAVEPLFLIVNSPF